MTTTTHAPDNRPVRKHLEVIPVLPPPQEQRRRRVLRVCGEGEKPTRYTLPDALDSSSPIGFRTRVSFTTSEMTQMLPLLSLETPPMFVVGRQTTEQELFEETSLGILSARQSTNFRGHFQSTVSPTTSKTIANIIRSLDGNDGPILDECAHTHVVFCRPYRTRFTLLLTMIGHKPVASLITVPIRAFRKKFFHDDDIPTIGYLTDLHLGVLHDAMRRAAIIASRGRRQTNVILAPFAGEDLRKRNRGGIRAIETAAGLSAAQRRQGFRLAFVCQVGDVDDGTFRSIPSSLYERLGANLLSLRSERIQPGVNVDDKAPREYHERQDIDVPDALTVQAGRAAYNAFVDVAGCSREQAKSLLLLDRIDILKAGGKERIRAIRTELNEITDKLEKDLPLWVDLPTGKAFSRAVGLGRKAFGLAGQRMYVGGLSKQNVDAAGLPFERAVIATGAAAARAALYAELMGSIDIPSDCDLLAGICLMAGPVNQNDIGKSFYGYKDLLFHSFPNDTPTSLLMWTFKAKTVADPIGNEEQLLNRRRKGALVDLRPGPHEAVQVETHDGFRPFRKRNGRLNQERAFSVVGNFARSDDGVEIVGNRGSAWPERWREEALWPTARS